MKLEITEGSDTLTATISSDRVRFDAHSKTLLIFLPELDHPIEFLAVTLDSFLDTSNGVQLSALKRPVSGSGFAPLSCKIKVTF